jgi:hypothetical protein
MFPSLYRRGPVLLLAHAAQHSPPFFSSHRGPAWPNPAAPAHLRSLPFSLTGRRAPPVRVTPNLQPIPFPSSASHQAATAGQILAPLGLPTFNQCHQGAVKPPFTPPPSTLPVTPSRAHPLDGNQGCRPPMAIDGHCCPAVAPPFLLAL